MEMIAVRITRDRYEQAPSSGDKVAVVTDATWDAVERAESRRQRDEAIPRILDRRSRAPIRSDSEIAAARRQERT